MDNEINSPNQQSHKTITSAAGVNVMVVDDDVICLSIVAGILRTWRYQVVTVKNPLDALATLRSGSDFFHLVVTDVHMPELDGFEFQKKVQEEFQLPVVMMSADDKESSMLKGLEAGAAFYIVKPVNYDDLKNIWQYAVGPRKDNSVDMQDVGPAPEEESPVEKTPDDPVDIESVSSVNEVNQSKRDPKKKACKRVIEDSGKENSVAVSPKRTKVVWTTALHTRFLEAVRKIGLERAVPKRILELMNMPGLTRENVASHLQKYRIFLRRVAEASNSTGSSTGKSIAERTLRSSFATGHPSLLISALQQGFPQLLNQQLVGSFLQPGFPGNIQINDPTLRGAIFPNQQASSSNPRPQLGHGQGHSMNNQAYLQQQPFGNTNALPEANGGVMNGANPMQMNQQQTQARSELVPNAMSNNNFTVFEGSGNIHGVQNMESFNNSHLPPNFDCNNNIAGSGPMGLSNGFNGNYGSITGNINGNLALSESVNSGYHAQGAYSSVGFRSTNQPPTRFSNITQQNNNPMLLPSLSLLQQNDLGNGGGDNSYLLDHLMNTTAPMESVSPLQFAESELDELFQGHLNNLHNNEQQVGEEVQSHGYSINLNPVENNPPENQPSSNQIESGVEIMGYVGNGIDQLDDYFLSFEPQNPNQQQGGGDFQETGPYHGYPNMNPAWNQASHNFKLDHAFGGINNDIVDSMLGRGMY
ncbi:hypothetical protein AAG906_016326 [Vitis piasezkii]